MSGEEDEGGEKPQVRITDKTIGQVIDDLRDLTFKWLAERSEDEFTGLTLIGLGVGFHVYLSLGYIDEFFIVVGGGILAAKAIIKIYERVKGINKPPDDPD